MKQKFGSILTLIVVIIMCAACQQKYTSTCQNPAGFEIKRGTNLSHWLSQDFGWEDKYTYINEKDIEFIANAGFDHVRIPVDEIELWDEEGNRVEEAFEYLHACLGWCKKYNLNAIVDLHTIRAHHFNASNEGGHNTLWEDVAAQDHFVNLWTQLSAELKKYPVNEVAYELMNEAVAPEHDNWNKLINRGIAEIRKNEPNRVIVVGANMWQIAPNLQYLKLPEGDKNIILSFHTYSPMLLTHYTANWTQLKNYVGDVNYPGTIISEEEYNANVDSTNEATFQFYQDAREVWDPDRILEGFKMGIDFADSLNLQLFCGEFGCMPTVPRKARLQYYSDFITVLEQNNVAWCNWEYKGDFGIYFWDGDKLKSGKPDTEFIDILMQFKQQ